MRGVPKTKAIVTLLVGLLYATAHAQSASRDDFVNRIEDAIGRPDPVAASSPLVTSMLTTARNANPGVDSSTWDSVRAETAAILTKRSSGPGSAFDNRVRAGLARFTDSELQRLLTKLNDPLLVKFRDVMKLEQNGYKNAFLSDALQMTSEINDILAKHDLQQVSFGPTRQSR
jgi:hypothetical protein